MDQPSRLPLRAHALLIAVPPELQMAAGGVCVCDVGADGAADDDDIALWRGE